MWKTSTNFKFKSYNNSGDYRKFGKVNFKFENSKTIKNSGTFRKCGK